MDSVPALADDREEHVRQALAEIDGGVGGDATWLARHLGPRRAGASRTIALSADDAARELDAYLRAAGATVAPPAGLVGLPLAVAAAAASRSVYRGVVAETADRVESLLDRLEHRELARPRARRLWLLEA